MMKKTTSVNVCTGPGCSYSFLHLTLEEYLTALHIAIANPSDFEMFEWLVKEDSVVVRFLAGMCRHDEYHSDPAVYQELVQKLSNNQHGLQFVHCICEYPNIMDSVKVDYSNCNTIVIAPSVGFDWYVTGYCISHFDEQWQLVMCHPDEGMDLFLKGFRSSPIAKGRIRYLSLHELSFSQTFLPLTEFCQLHSLELNFLVLIMMMRLSYSS